MPLPLCSIIPYPFREIYQAAKCTNHFRRFFAVCCTYYTSRKNAPECAVWKQYPAGQVIIRCRTAEAHTGERGANVRRHPKRLFIYECRSHKFVHISSRKYNEPSTPCERQSSLLVINLASVYTLLCGAVVQSVKSLFKLPHFQEIFSSFFGKYRKIFRNHCFPALKYPPESQHTDRQPPCHRHNDGEHEGGIDLTPPTAGIRTSRLSSLLRQSHSSGYWRHKLCRIKGSG